MRELGGDRWGILIGALGNLAVGVLAISLTNPSELEKEVKSNSYPNESIFLSLKNGLFIGLVNGISGLVISALGIVPLIVCGGRYRFIHELLRKHFAAMYKLNQE